MVSTSRVDSIPWWQIDGGKWMTKVARKMARKTIEIVETGIYRRRMTRKGHHFASFSVHAAGFATPTHPLQLLVA